MGLGTAVETFVWLAIFGCFLYFVILWIYNDSSIEEKEDELAKIRGKDNSYMSICSIRDEYSLYVKNMNKAKFTLSYEEWLATRITIETQ